MKTSQLLKTATTMAALTTLTISNVHAQSDGGFSEDQLDNVRSTPGTVVSGNKKLKLTLSGQVNRGILSYDDGDDSGSIFVDNDNSSTRIRLLSETPDQGGVRFGTNIELQFESNSTASVDQENQHNVGPNSFTERKLEAYGDFAGIGRLTLGQGDTSSNGTSEQDLSGTGVIGYSGVADLASGLKFRDSDGILTDIDIGSVFSNLDGLSRDDRLRYDTPDVNGLKGSVSLIADERWDVSASYSLDLGIIKARTALAYADVGEDLDNRINGSFSLLHDSGFSLTFAAGRDDRDDRDPQFAYTKFGYQASWTSLGKTALSVDFYNGEDISIKNDESTSVGFQLVQNLNSLGAELYAGIRNYELDLAGSTAADLDDVLATLIGARVKF
ncbi:MAG: hypothetical protein V3U76_09720 [Granulosicoccus sp.]